MAKIEVKLNPDVKPSGSDLAVVNSARRSFNTRSEWDTVTLSQQKLEESGDTYVDKHTGPILTFAIFALTLVGVGILLVHTSGWVGLVIVNGVILFFSAPWWSVYLWNRFVADEDEYHD